MMERYPPLNSSPINVLNSPTFTLEKFLGNGSVKIIYYSVSFQNLNVSLGVLNTIMLYQ